MKKKTRNILLLGGKGFLGMNILDYYNTVISRDVDAKLFFIIVGSSPCTNIDLPNSKYYQINFLDESEVRQLFENYIIDEVFHFISTSVPATSNNNIKNDIASNLLGTLNLLDLMVEFKVEKLIYLSSGGTVYGEDLDVEYQEDKIHTPKSSYGVLKLTIESYIQLYQKLHGVNYLILRISNPFGLFHQSETNGLINIAIRKSLKGEQVEVWGDGEIKKDYLYAKDFAKIFWQLDTLKLSNMVLNIGSGKLYSINEILELIKSILPNTLWCHENEKIFDTKNIDFKIDKLKNLLSFINTPLSVAIQETCQWEKNKK